MKRPREHEASLPSMGQALQQQQQQQQQQQGEHEEDIQDMEILMQPLINCLNSLSKALDNACVSEQSGTPAIHMYSILDQVAALRAAPVLAAMAGMQQKLHEVDVELVRILKHCNDDEKRKGVRSSSVILPLNLCRRNKLIPRVFCREFFIKCVAALSALLFGRIII